MAGCRAWGWCWTRKRLKEGSGTAAATGDVACWLVDGPCGWAHEAPTAAAAAAGPWKAASVGGRGDGDGGMGAGALAWGPAANLSSLAEVAAASMWVAADAACNGGHAAISSPASKQQG